MFTGIVEEVGKVHSVRPGSLIIMADRVFDGLEIGGSIAVNGVCLTVTRLDNNSFTVDIMPETIEKSNLGLLSNGDSVNLESPLSLSSRLGGHLVQGHIDATGKVLSVRRDGEAMIIDFEAPPEVMRYIVEKGFIAVDGISLTVVNKTVSSFQVSVVSHTRQNTNLGDIKVRDTVNLEVDIIAKYVEQLSQAGKSGITAGFLQEHGFL